MYRAWPCFPRLVLQQSRPPWAPARRAMPKPCQRDRLREAYYQATLEASALTGVLQSASFGPEFSAALDKAEIARSAWDAARRAYLEHCEEHGCEDDSTGRFGR